MAKNHICERCQDLALIVHHKIELTPANINDPTIALSHDNLEALCQTCHNKQHKTAAKSQPRYTFSSTGDIEPSTATGDIEQCPP